MSVTITYGNCPSYTRDDSSHLTGSWLAMVGAERLIKNALGFVFGTERNH